MSNVFKCERITVATLKDSFFARVSSFLCVLLHFPTIFFFWQNLRTHYLLLYIFSVLREFVFHFSFNFINFEPLSLFNGPFSPSIYVTESVFVCSRHFLRPWFRIIVKQSWLKHSRLGNISLFLWSILEWITSWVVLQVSALLFSHGCSFVFIGLLSLELLFF